MRSLLAAEILKTRKRWMPYSLLLVCIAGIVVLIFFGGYLDWKNTDEFSERQIALYTFTMPYSIPALLDSGQFWGSMFTGILVASVVATEFSWGTVRQAVIRGQSRTAFLAVKLAGVSLMAAAMLLTALMFGILLSIFTTDLAGLPVTLDVPDGPNITDVIAMIMRAGWCIVPYGMLAFMLAVVSRSGTLAITGIILFLFGEALAIAILESVGDPGPALVDVSIGENVKSLVAENGIGLVEYNFVSLRDRPDPSTLANPSIAALILAAHTALYAAIAFTVFARRDIKA